MKNIREKLAIIWTITIVLHIGFMTVAYGMDAKVREQENDLIKAITFILVGFYFGSMHKEDSPDPTPPKNETPSSPSQTSLGQNN